VSSLVMGAFAALTLCRDELEARALVTYNARSEEVPPMPKAKQLTVFCENRPGSLAQIARVLGDAKVNILAFVTIPFPEGSVQVVVDNANKARKALDGAVLSYSEADVLYVELPNMPGALGSFAGKLATKEINIASGYATVAKGAKKASVVLAVSDLDQAARVR